MAKIKRQSLIPLAPLDYVSKLSQEQRDCIVWHVLSGCSQTEAFIKFVHPEFATTPAIASRLSGEFFGTKEACEFVDLYRVTIRDLMSAKVAAEPTIPDFVIERKENETDEEYDMRRKREAAEIVVQKIISRVNGIDEIEDLIDTIKAMEKTGFFKDELRSEMPPMRYLPETCGECKYKEFVEEQIKLGNISEQ